MMTRPSPVVSHRLLLIRVMLKRNEITTRREGTSRLQRKSSKEGEGEEQRRAKMSVELVDGTTIRDFVEDETSFNDSVEGRFAALDVNRDGVLSYGEMTQELASLRLLETHFGLDEEKTEAEEELHGLVFAKFDRDGSGAVDLEEYRAETREMLLAVAKGLGFLPVQMVLDEGSLLKMAADRESSKLLTARADYL
ncbi:uncharacterized protein LOC144713076 [Wolffia australiana]